MKMGKKRNAQVSMEYLVIMGFVTLAITINLGIAFIYSANIQDKIKLTQIENFGNKIISSAESIFYYGEPSKSTISAYLPKEVKEIIISDNELFLTIQLSSGLNKLSFPSDVPISGNISIVSGVQKIEIIADNEKANINSI